MKSILILLLSMAVSAPCAEVPQATWEDYLSTQDGEAEWANTVRGMSRGNSGTGVLRVSTSEAFNFQPLLQSVAQVTGTKDLILPVGGLGSGRRVDIVDNYMRLIRYDNGERWRRLVFEQTTVVAKSSPQRQIYWQIGNEINSWHFLETLEPWLDSDEVVTRDPVEDNRRVRKEDEAERTQRRQKHEKFRRQSKRIERINLDEISLYVEYFLAPTAQAIINARKQDPAYDSRTKIVLGTIANSRNEQARIWLDTLLDYQIRGDYSSQLAGRKVSDVVDIIALHYMASSWGPEWRTSMRGLYEKWLGKGSIRGIWVTEEIGRKRAVAGVGGATAISVLSRYMDLWNELGIDPSQGRVNFWGWNMGDKGTQGSDAMQTFSGLVGDTQLISMAEGEVTLQSTGDYESHIFKTSNEKLLIVAYASEKQGGFRFRGFKTKWNGEKEPQVEVIVFGQQGQTRLEPELTLKNGMLTVSTKDKLTSRDVILVIVDRG